MRGAAVAGTTGRGAASSGTGFSIACGASGAGAGTAGSASCTDIGGMAGIRRTRATVTGADAGSAEGDRTTRCTGFAVLVATVLVTIVRVPTFTVVVDGLSGLGFRSVSAAGSMPDSACDSGSDSASGGDASGAAGEGSGVPSGATSRLRNIGGCSAEDISRLPGLSSCRPRGGLIWTGSATAGTYENHTVVQVVGNHPGRDRSRCAGRSSRRTSRFPASQGSMNVVRSPYTWTRGWSCTRCATRLRDAVA